MVKKLEESLVGIGYFLIRHWLALFIAAVLLFIVPIVAYPYLMATGNPALQSLAGLIQIIYKTTCHQLPERSLFLFSYKMAVCSRCFAIYAAFLAGCLIFLPIRRLLKIWSIRYFIVICIPMAIDGFAQLFHVAIPRTIGSNWELIWMFESTNEIRIVTGFIFGLACALYVLPYLEEIFSGERHYNGNKIEKTPTPTPEKK